MYLYAHTVMTENGRGRHKHCASRAEASFSVVFSGSGLISGYRACVTRVKLPCSWKKAFVALANDPSWLNDLPHEEVK